MTFTLSLPIYKGGLFVRLLDRYICIYVYKYIYIPIKKKSKKKILGKSPYLYKFIYYIYHGISSAAV
jgi:hypothetical protein